MITLDNPKRAQAWQKDTKFIIAQYYIGLYKVIGEETWFNYKDNMTQQDAKDYADELNKNKNNSSIYSV